MRRRSAHPAIGWIRNASVSRKPTWIDRVGRLDSGAYAAMTSWYAENASAMNATTCAASPLSSRLTPVSSNALACGSARSRGFIAGSTRASLDQADLLVILLGAGMERYGHARQRFLQVDRPRGGVRGDELIEARPQRLGHAVHDVRADAVVRHEEVLHRGGRHVARLPVV